MPYNVARLANQLANPASAPVTKPTELRDRLLTVIGDWLGEFRDGSPAIWVGRPPKRLGPVTGIQAVIEPVPRLWGAPIGIGSEMLLDQSWEVLITNFDDQGGHLGGLVQRLLSLPGVRGGVYLMASDDTYEQYRLSLACPGFIDLWVPPAPPFPADWLALQGDRETWLALGDADYEQRLLLI